MTSSNHYMKRAFELAREALGKTSPNPAVGAVVVKEGRVIGEGHTQPPGQAHAEVVALREAGPDAAGAALYVTMEPCSIHGRTPPCTDAVIHAGISKVHVASKDPNPRVNGQGISLLESAGVSVETGEEAKTAERLYEAFKKHINTGLPYVTAKFAMSLDGKIASRTGHSKWVTGPKSRERVQEIRRVSDAVMVGVNTVVKDDPKLTARDDLGLPLEQQPLRVVVDSSGRTPTGSALLKEPGRTLIAGSKMDSETARALESAGAETICFHNDETGRVDLPSLMAHLGSIGVVSLMVEGGGTLMGSLLDEGLLDKVYAFIAPVIVGGEGVQTPVGGRGAETMYEALRLRDVTVETIDDDVLVVGYPDRSSKKD